MKVNLIAEKKLDGTFVYYTETDGVYVNNSLSLDRDKALELYELIKVNNGEWPKPQKEVLQSVEL